MTEVKAEGFKNVGATKVYVPDSVTKIGKGAFAENNITELTVPVLGDGQGNAFLAYIFGADSADNASAVPETLRKLVVGGNAAPAANALKGIDWLNDLTLPALGDLSVANLFGGGDYITGIEIFAVLGGDSIEKGALAGMSALKELTVPFVGATKNDTGEEGLFGYIFGSDSYSGSFEIKSGLSAEDYISPELCFTFYVPQGLKKVTVLDGDVFDGAFMNMRTLTEVVFADDADTTYIGEAAFMGATALEGFTVPAGVSIVGDYAFCFSGVRTVDMSAADEITVLPEYIFGENTRLATISLPENLVTIEGYAFYMASALKNIVIPDSVTTIGEYAFYACTSLESVSPPANLKTLGRKRVFTLPVA